MKYRVTLGHTFLISHYRPLPAFIFRILEISENQERIQRQ